MQNNQKLAVAIHFTMAFCGGLLGAYALFSRQLVFGSAQTANLMELVSAICGRDLPDVLIRLGALAIYGWAVSLSVILTRKTAVNLKYTAIFLEIPAVFISPFIPASVNPVAALYPIFFVTAFQWCAFKGVGEFSSSTIFSTNNVKQTVLGLTEYCLEKEPSRKKQQGKKAAFFGGTLLSFHTGVAVEYIALQTFSFRAVWLCFLPLTAGLLLSAAENRKGITKLSAGPEARFSSSGSKSLLNQREAAQ